MFQTGRTKVKVSFMLVIVMFLLTVFLMVVYGCTAHQASTFKEDFSAKPMIRFQVGSVSNLTGKNFDVDVSQMFKDALHSALSDANLLASDASDNKVLLNSNIVEYEKGSALKRWFLPGWGSTVLKVRVDLKEAVSGKDLGQVEAERSVNIGGGLTIGAWKSIVTDVAQDVVKELQNKLVQKS